MDKLKFPTTLKEFREQFSEEAACFEYLGPESSGHGVCGQL